MAKKPANNKKGAGKPKSAKPQAAYFLSLTLQNVRCFGEETQTLDLSDGNGRPAQWTILLGNNGTGKTTVLQALASMRTGKRLRAAGSPPDVTPRSASSVARLSIQLACGETLSNASRNSEFGEEEVTLTPFEPFESDAVSPGGVTMSIAPGGAKTENRRKLQQAPLCYGYGASRRMGQTTLQDDLNDDPAESLFSDHADLVNAEEWLLRLDYSASKKSDLQEQLQARRDSVLELLKNLLPDVDKIRFTLPAPEKTVPGVAFHTPFGWVPLRGISYGYQTILAWMVDFASRMVARYPDSKDPLSEPAVVLVDEIDLHLHPRWQREITGYLTEQFPNTQFIVTAHSPLVIQSAPNANIALLRREGDHTVIDNNKEAVRGWRIDQIYTSDLFGLPTARPPQFDAALKERETILTKSELTKSDQDRLRILEAEIGQLPTGESAEMSRSMKLVDDTLHLLKSHQDEKA